ncbi:hypothetical protein D6817_01080 [Candidatus Pacearchaeota archaeon]|nr:MAG: hypothetical protein D6817_01080 [Candidatus Pacearchaeota archaeon]
MVAKRGFLRLLEATIAVLVVLGAMLLLSSQRTPRQAEDLTQELYPYLDEVALNSTFRDNITAHYDTSQPFDSGQNKEIRESIENFIRKRLANPRLDLTVRICDVDKLCPLEPLQDYLRNSDGDIFSAERIVTPAPTSPAGAQTRKIRLFLWRKR